MFFSYYCKQGSLLIEALFVIFLTTSGVYALARLYNVLAYNTHFVQQRLRAIDYALRIAHDVRHSIINDSGAHTFDDMTSNWHPVHTYKQLVILNPCTNNNNESLFYQPVQVTIQWDVKNNKTNTLTMTTGVYD